MADTRDLKSLVQYWTCGFESRSWHFRAPSPIFVAGCLKYGLVVAF